MSNIIVTKRSGKKEPLMIEKWQTQSQIFLPNDRVTFWMSQMKTENSRHDWLIFDWFQPPLMINGTIVLRKTKLKNADLTLVTDICTGFF